MTSRIRCPLCQGESVAESPSASAQDITNQIRQQIEAGWTDRQSTFFTLAGGTEVSNAQGIDNTGLDLYWITNTNTGALDNGAAVTSTVGEGIYQGSFQISSAGVVSFNVTAVPEPSRALLAGLGLAGIAFRRRRSAKKIA